MGVDDHDDHAAGLVEQVRQGADGPVVAVAVIGFGGEAIAVGAAMAPALAETP